MRGRPESGPAIVHEILRPPPRHVGVARAHGDRDGHRDVRRGDRRQEPAALDDAYAAASQYGGRVAHGALLVGFVSAVLANKLPGPGSVAREMSIRFRKPVRPGDVVVSKVVVRELVEKTRKVTFDCFSYVGGELVAKGDASALLPD